MKKFVSYVRVSTDKQGESGLGLAAQKAAINKYLQDLPHEMIAEFLEVDSGGNNGRVELAKAVKLCQTTGATLIFAKLDRLGRDASYLYELRKAIDILDVEMPDVSPLLFAVKAGMAEDERMRISSRTKQALQAKRARGEVWVSNPTGKGSKEAASVSAKSRKRMACMNDDTRRALGFIRLLVERGETWTVISNELNYWSFPSATGLEFTPTLARSLWVGRHRYDYFKILEEQENAKD